MKQPAVLRDGHALAECYEALRKEAVAADGGGRTLAGRALLMFKGMAAWMKSMGEAPVRTLRGAAASTEMRQPVSIEHNLVNLVVTMTLASALEGRA